LIQLQNAVYIIYTEQLEEWQLLQNFGAKMLLSQKNAIQIVAIGNRQHNEIGLDQCDIRRSRSSNR